MCFRVIVPKVDVKIEQKQLCFIKKTYNQKTKIQYNFVLVFFCFLESEVFALLKHLGSNITCGKKASVEGQSEGYKHPSPAC